jgi:hypothetical protein
MINTVTDFIAGPKTGPFEAIPHYTDVTAALTGLRGDIDEGLVIESQNTTGPAKLKQQLEIVLIDTSIKVIRKMKPYATFSGNTILMTEIDHTKTSLKRLPDRTLLSHCSRIHDLMREHMETLLGYGLTEGLATKYESDIEAYKNSLTTIRLTKTANSGARSDVNDLVKEAMSLLNDRLDILVDSVRDEYPDLCAEYDRVRTIIDK